MVLKPLSTAAYHRWAAAADSSPAADGDYHGASASAAAARPAARVVRVGRPLRPQQQQPEKGTIRENVHCVSTIMDRRDDAELQQIARQELEASDDDVGFTLGEIIERSTEQLEQQHSRRPQEEHSQQKRQHGGSRVQQMLREKAVDACVRSGHMFERAQGGCVRRPGAVPAAPSGVNATAAAGVGEASFGGPALHGSRERGRCSVFLEPHNVEAAPLGFPRPVHRSVLRQQLQQLHTQEGERLQGRHVWGEEQRKMEADQHEGKPQQQSDTSAMRCTLSCKKGKEPEGMQIIACTGEADSGVEHARCVSTWCRRADDRASIEAEAGELLRAMHPREIAAARQELLDRFGPKRFAALQRRALRRAAFQQQTPPTQEPEGVWSATDHVCSEAGTGGQKGVRQEIVSSRVVEKQQVSAPPRIFALSSGDTSHCTHSAFDRGSSATRPCPAGSSAAVPSAYVSFASGRRGHAVSRKSAPSSSGGGGKTIPADEIDATAAACGPTAVPPGPSSVRFDIHQVAKLRWTDPLGPEDWQNGPFEYPEGLHGANVTGPEMAVKQFSGPCETLSSAVAAEKANHQLHRVACATAFANIQVHLERLRFDFDGRLRSDLLHVQGAVIDAVRGARAAQRMQVRQSYEVGRRATHVQRLQGSLQGLCTQQSQDRHAPQEEREEGGAALSTGESRQPTEGNEVTAIALNASHMRGALAASVREVEVVENLGKPVASGRGADTKKKDRDTASAARGANPVREESEVSSGNTSEDSDPLEFYRGLHHHGDAAALPGYTLGELLHLAQSSNHAQAALALQTLAAVIRSGRTLFSCPSIAEAAAFAASMRHWADQQQDTRQPNRMLPHKLLQRERHVQEEELQHKEIRQNHDEGQSSPQQQAEHTTKEPAAYAEQHNLDTVDVDVAQDDAADAGTSTLDTDTFPPSKMKFEARAGYCIGLRRWYCYVARDLYLVWRLHALLHAQAAPVYRASLCCLAAFFGPPALSGIRRPRVGCWSKSRATNAVCDAAAGVSGGDSIANNECNNRSSNIAVEHRERRRDTRCGDGNISQRSSSSACGRRSNGAGTCGSEAAAERGHREAVMRAPGTRQLVDSGEEVEAHPGGISASAVSEGSLLRASEQRTAHWGPGLAPLPLHLKTLPQQLTTGLLKHQPCEVQQVQKRRFAGPQTPQKCALQQHVAKQQTWKNERMRQRHRQRKQGTLQQPGEGMDYVCVWGLGGVDFVTEGLLVVDCCSGLRNIDLNENTCASSAVAVGGDSSGGCRGVFAFWHAFFERVSTEGAVATACVQQPQQLVRGPVSPKGSQQGSVDKKAGEEQQRDETKTGSAPLATPIEKVGLEHASAGSSEDKGVGVTTSSSGGTTAAAVSQCCAFRAVNAAQERAEVATTMPRGGTLEESMEITEATSESVERDRETTLLYDSVGALFGSSPVEALLEHGKLLQRLALLLCIHRTDEDFERHVLQLLLGLSAAGAASTACMLSNEPLQKRIRSLAEGLLIGSAARTERLQQQTLQHSLAVATSRAAQTSSSSTAGVYFGARAEIHRRTGRCSSSMEGSQRCMKKTSDNATSSCAISCRQNDTKHWCDSPTKPAQQEDIKLLKKEPNTRGFLLRHTEYLLLRELLLLLRLWAGWAPTEVQDRRTSSSSEAAAAAAWKNTLVGQDSACCSLLLQAFTDGVFLVEAATTGEETVKRYFSGGVISGKAAGAEIEGLPAASGDESAHCMKSFEPDAGEPTANTPADEDILIAAVEAARVLRVLEARGVLPHMFASFYPSAVQLVHSFTKRLGELQEKLLHVSQLSDGESHNEAPDSTQQQSGEHRQQQKASPQHGDPCDLGPELQQQMQELQQHDLHLQHRHGAEAGKLSEFFQKLGVPLDLTGQHPSVQAVTETEHTNTPSSSGDGGEKNSNTGGRRRLHRGERSTQRDVAFAWIFHGALVKELLRWGAVSVGESESTGDANVDAHEFLLQVTPLLRVVPSLLHCWKQLESHCGLLDSFANAAAVQLLHAATQLLLVATRRVARAVCSCDFIRSRTIGGNTVHDPLASKSELASETSTSLIGDSYTHDNETRSRGSSNDSTSNIKSSTFVTAESSAVQEAAVSCWISLTKPLAETLFGPVTEQTTARCSDLGSVERSAAIPQVQKCSHADPGGLAGGVADGGCGSQQADMQTRGAWHSMVDGFVSECGAGKTLGGLLRLMDKMKVTCSRDGGSVIAKALTLYAIETGWTSLTSCCCSQCLPCLSQEPVRNSCGVTPAPSANVSRLLRRSRWRGLLPATSESFAGTEVVDCFAALSAVPGCCSMPPPRRCRGQHASDHCASAASESYLRECHEDVHPSTRCSERSEAEKNSGGSTSTGGEMASVYNCTSRAKLSSEETGGTRTGGDYPPEEIWISGISRGKADTVVLAPKSTPYVPQDIELFLSEASFLSTVCSWIASSLHVLHHCMASGFAGSSRETTRERASSNSRSGDRLTQQPKRSDYDKGNCVPQTVPCRGKSSFYGVDERGNTRDDDFETVAASVTEKDTSEQFSIFSPEVLEKLAEAAAGLALALCGTLQCLFQEVRWPQQSHFPFTPARSTTAGVSGSATPTWPKDCSSQQQQQRHPQHHVKQHVQQRRQGPQQHGPVSSRQHQATVISRPLVLFEPLAQLMLALQLVLRACERFSAKRWIPADEQRCVLAACSAAATPRTFLHAVLMLYHAVTASSLGEIKKQPSFLSDHEHNVQTDEQLENELQPGLQAVWLKGAAQWFSICCDSSLLAQHYTPNHVAVPAAKLTQDAAHIYKLLRQAVAQSGVPLEHHQRMSALRRTAGRTWPWVICALDSLDVLVNNAAKPQQDRLSNTGAKTVQAYTEAVQRPRQTLFSQQLAVCPIDGIVGGGIWQCFCCEAALAPEHRRSMVDSATLSNSLNEALSLCHLVVRTSNLAQELHRYVPPSAIFAALVGLYTEPHLTSATKVGGSCRALQPHEAGLALDHLRASVFSIYARPTVYDLFCRLLEKLLLQPLGKQFRAHALRQQSEKRQPKQEQGGHRRGAQDQEAQQACGVENAREALCEEGEHQRRKGGEKHERATEDEREKHRQADRLHGAGVLLSSASVPREYLYFSRSFLATVCRACETEPCASRRQVSFSADRSAESPLGALQPQDCFHWFPVCCNKAQDVLIERAARLLLVSQSAADAADPLVSLLLWLLSSPAFPLECRRMLVRGEQTWLKMASQLFCFVCDVKVAAFPGADQQPECPRELQLQQHQPQTNRQQPEQPQHVTELDHQFQGDPEEEVEQWHQAGKMRRPKASDMFAPATSLQRGSCWGMQSPRGDVFWFTATDSLYVALPGLWREDSEDILVGWSSYVQDRLAKGSFLSDWQPTSENTPEGTSLPLLTTLTSPRETCFIALFPLHALALLVADEMSYTVVPSPFSFQAGNAYGGTHEPAQQEGLLAERHEQVSVGHGLYLSTDAHQPTYTPERENRTPTLGANVNFPESAQHGQKQALRGPELKCDRCSAARGNQQTTSASRTEETETRYWRLNRFLSAHGASDLYNVSEAVVAELTDDITRIICGSRR